MGRGNGMRDPHWMNGDPYALDEEAEDEGIEIPDPEDCE